jgi:DNA-binding NarL/FixJ family response regulator
MSIRLLLVDDHQMLREGLAAMLAKEDDFEVVGQASDGQTALHIVEEVNPDVIILDVSLPDMNGTKVMRQLARRDLSPKVVVLSMYTDRRYVMEMLEAGASAYVMKVSAFEELARAVRATMQNQMYLSPEITELIIVKYRELLAEQETSSTTLLTERESEIVRLLASGLSTGEIAHSLSISPKTVASHRKNLMDKLGLRSIAELTMYAIQEGLIEFSK